MKLLLLLALSFAAGCTNSNIISEDFSLPDNLTGMQEKYVLPSLNETKMPESLQDLNETKITGKCPPVAKEYDITGHSLEPILIEGDVITGLLGYYDCNPVGRGDLVLLKFSWYKVPVIKIVKGIPGDSLSLLPAGDGFSIVVNGEIAVNSEGRPYHLKDDRAGMISNYVKSYNGIIPKDAYLVLGNVPEGTLDSTQVGLLDISYFIGKVLIQP